ncbi:hypothetical protein VTH06DRAFT_6187 [Thermothelomyces fergusii]
MPADRGAKFLHEFCAFGQEDHTTFAPASSRPRTATTGAAAAAAAIAARSLHDADGARRLWANASAELSLRPPFALLLSEPEFPGADDGTAAAWGLFRRAASALALLEKRQWACPGGTRSCASIGFPNSCCGVDETCVEVADTGLGPVGCCPSGATCSGGVSGCADGSTACGSDIGGGCCIPGFVCMGIGCVRPSSSSSSSSPPPAPTPTTLTTTSTLIVSDPTRSTTVVTVTTTVTPSEPPVTSTVTETTTASSSRNGDEPGAPFRPTSSAQSSTTGTDAYCPTGYYPCLARAGGGCCQTGRDCAVTSCPPPPPQTTVVDDNGVTVVVPADGAAATTTTAADACAAGWFLCGRDAGPDPGCCPSGYECGTASCFREGAGATGADVAKELPGHSGSAGKARAEAGWGLVVVVGISMLWGVGMWV